MYLNLLLRLVDDVWVFHKDIILNSCVILPPLNTLYSRVPGFCPILPLLSPCIFPPFLIQESNLPIFTLNIEHPIWRPMLHALIHFNFFQHDFITQWL